MNNQTDEELRVACTKETQRATFDDFLATQGATKAQPDSLKALSRLVLARNQARNHRATEAEKPRNFTPEKTPQKLRGVAEELREVSPLDKDKIAAKAEPLSWRFTATRADGSTAGFSFASGATLAEAEEHAARYWPGSTVTALEPYPTDQHQGEPMDVDALARSIATQFNITPEQALSFLDDDDRRDIEAGDAGMVEAWKGFVGLAQRQRTPGATLPMVETESAGAELWAVLRTPAGGAVRIRARDKDHLAWLLKMNPPPPGGAGPENDDSHREFHTNSQDDEKQIRFDACLYEEIPTSPSDQVEYGAITPTQFRVRCADCRHRQPTAHPVLVHCGIGKRAPGACGAWWGLDWHPCEDFKESPV